MVFNGEIYNFAEVRAELIARGHRFRTHSDTEIIVHGYEEWGERCVERFRGMFAFALYDAKARRLLLARDRAGGQPTTTQRFQAALSSGRRSNHCSRMRTYRASGVRRRSMPI